YSYPGVEDSTSAGGWMTSRRAVSTLEAVLRVAREPGPFIVVGHSIAGLETQLFVGERASEIRGVVLFDPTSPLFAASRAGRVVRNANWLPGLSARQDAVVTHWPDVPVRIFGHDLKQYEKAAPLWTAADERIWRRGQQAMARRSLHLRRPTEALTRCDQRLRGAGARKRPVSRAAAAEVSLPRRSRIRRPRRLRHRRHRSGRRA